MLEKEEEKEENVSVAFLWRKKIYSSSALPAVPFVYLPLLSFRFSSSLSPLFFFIALKAGKFQWTLPRVINYKFTPLPIPPEFLQPSPANFLRQQEDKHPCLSLRKGENLMYVNSCKISTNFSSKIPLTVFSSF